MRRFMMAAGLAVLSMPVPGQITSLGGPVETYIYDAPSRSIRGVLGTLGSAWLGPAVAGGPRAAEAIAFASVSPGRDYGVVRLAGGSVRLISGLGKPSTSERELSGAFEGLEGVAWSADGRAMILYSRTGNWMQRFSGLPDSAEPGARISWTEEERGRIAAIAANKTGDRWAVSLTGGVWELDAAGSWIQASSRAGNSLSYGEDGSLLVLDAAASEVEIIDLQSGARRAVRVEGLEDMIAVGVSGGVIYVASGRDRRLVSYSLASGEPQSSYMLGFEPDRVEPLGRDSYVLRARQQEGEPLWSFRRQPWPGVFFVPGAPLAAEGGDQQ